MIEGIDVSQANGQVDWPKVRKAGKRFAICKIDEGDWNDPTFTAARVKAIRAADMVPGGYVFLRPKPGRSGRTEMNWMLERGQRFGLWTADHQKVVDVRPVIDVERSAWDLGTPDGIHKTLHYVAEAIRECLHVLDRHPILYVGSLWRDELGDPPSSFGCPLWYPEYGVSHPHHVPRAWPHGPAIWQYSGDVAKVPGVGGTCDLNRYDGSLGSFRRELCI